MSEHPVPEMRLELVPVPVSDVDRAKAFYERIGFGNVHDNVVSDGMRVVQFTPPGSSCAIVFGTGMGPITEMVPGSVKGLHLVVKDIGEARSALVERGVEASEVQDIGGVKYVWFNDPDGNMWALQQWPEGYEA
jgi:catechol 2,3-dioxygenase-like lactoylglutathione lyase family enzyme